MCKDTAKTINFFSDEPIIPEVEEIYTDNNFIQPPKKSPLSIPTTARDTVEINKIHQRIPNWFNSPNQINSTVLINFMQLKDANGSVSYSDLEQRCKSIKKFKGNFDQMINFGQKNHGKVFEWSGTNIDLWQPVSVFIENEYKKHPAFAIKPTPSAVLAALTGSELRTAALKILKQTGRYNDLNDNNFTCKNIGETNAKEGWWLQIENTKFNSDYYILLNYGIKQELYIFFISSGTIKEPEKIFRMEGSKANIKIYVNQPFIDRDGPAKFDFAPYRKEVL
ncbi:MAG: hypothetical protein LBU51_03265 [Bacteroidales bacterium]|jgi:hypothetical protein|nr:hypothetical protein [Bacteroidales bacterium]